MALSEEIHGHRIKVLPLLYLKCDVPGFLLDKVYADFSVDFEHGFAALLERLAAGPVSAIILSDGTEFSADLETLTKDASFSVRPLRDLRFSWENEVPGAESIVPRLIVVVRGERASQTRDVDLYGKIHRFVAEGGQLFATSWVCWENLKFRALAESLPVEYLTEIADRENETVLCKPTSGEMSRVFFPGPFALQTSLEGLRAKQTAHVLLETEEGVPIVAPGHWFARSVLLPE